jgi:hypothetical protein
MTSCDILIADTGRRGKLTDRTIRFYSGAPIWCGKRCRLVVIGICMRCANELSLICMMPTKRVSGSISDHLTTTHQAYATIQENRNGITGC